MEEISSMDFPQHGEVFIYMVKLDVLFVALEVAERALHRP
jgi:hypothetical protein